MDDDIYRMAISHAMDNPFKDYLGFLQEMGELTEAEQLLCEGLGREFVHLLETTNMSKVYKMPVLMAFYNHGNVCMAVTEEELLMSWKEFFVQKDAYALALMDELEEVVKLPVFSEQMGDVIAYRTMDYYQRRYRGEG